MPEIMHALKAELVKRGLKTKAVSDASGIPYDRLVRVLNGYTYADPDVVSQVRAQIKRFDEAQAVDPGGVQ